MLPFPINIELPTDNFISKSPDFLGCQLKAKAYLSTNLPKANYFNQNQLWKNMELKKGSQSLKTIIADDNFFIRRACRYIVKECFEGSLIEEARSRDELVSILNNSNCNLLIINAEFIGGIESLRDLLINIPAIKILLIVYPQETFDYKGIFKLSSVGIITPDTREEEIITAIHSVIIGNKYIASEMHDIVFDQMANREAEKVLSSLTERELEVAHMIKSGLRSVQIAEKLKISDKTVEAHRRKIYKKLKVNNVISLIAFFKSNGIA